MPNQIAADGNTSIPHNIVKYVLFSLDLSKVFSER